MTTSPVVGTGVDPVTSRFSGGIRPHLEAVADHGKCKKYQVRARNLRGWLVPTGNILGISAQPHAHSHAAAS